MFKQQFKIVLVVLAFLAIMGFFFVLSNHLTFALN